MNSDSPLELDGDKELIKKFESLTGNEQKQAKRAALREGSKILIRGAKANLRRVTRNAGSPNWWNGKTLESGIKLGKAKNSGDNEASVHIMGDFRLKFFQNGTKNRVTRKTGANRGYMKRTNFFTNAVSANRDQISNSVDRLFSESINRLWNKK